MVGHEVHQPLLDAKGYTNFNTLEARTNLQPDSIAELLEFFLRSTFFCYDGMFYKQCECAAMGSPVSVVEANLYMEHFESLALESAPVCPILWK